VEEQEAEKGEKGGGKRGRKKGAEKGGGTGGGKGGGKGVWNSRPWIVGGWITEYIRVRQGILVPEQAAELRVQCDDFTEQQSRVQGPKGQFLLLFLRFLCGEVVVQ